MLLSVTGVNMKSAFTLFTFLKHFHDLMDLSHDSAIFKFFDRNENKAVRERSTECSVDCTVV